MDLDEKRPTKSTTALTGRDLTKKIRDTSKMAKEDQINPVSELLLNDV